MVFIPSSVKTSFLFNVSLYKSLGYYDNKLNLMDIESCCVAWDGL